MASGHISLLIKIIMTCTLALSFRLSTVRYVSMKLKLGPSYFLQFEADSLNKQAVFQNLKQTFTLGSV
jgi:hypothetical protein